MLPRYYLHVCVPIPLTVKVSPNVNIRSTTYARISVYVVHTKVRQN